MGVLLCNNLRQLLPVRGTKIYKTSKKQVRMQTEMPWQLYRLPSTCAGNAPELCSSPRCFKIGDGDPLDADDVGLLQSRFVSTAVAHNLCPDVARLFYSYKDADAYNSYLVTGDREVW